MVVLAVLVLWEKTMGLAEAVLQVEKAVAKSIQQAGE
jgi:hypothetical protein